MKLFFDEEYRRVMNELGECFFRFFRELFFDLVSRFRVGF